MTRLAASEQASVAVAESASPDGGSGVTSCHGRLGCSFLDSTQHAVKHGFTARSRSWPGQPGSEADGHGSMHTIWLARGSTCAVSPQLSTFVVYPLPCHIWLSKLDPIVGVAIGDVSIFCMMHVLTARATSFERASRWGRTWTRWSQQVSPRSTQPATFWLRCTKPHSTIIEAIFANSPECSYTWRPFTVALEVKISRH